MTDEQVTYTAEELAEHYQYTVATVWKRCRMYTAGIAGGWPHLRDGRSIRFSEENVSQIKKLMRPTPTTTERKRKRRSLAA